MKKIIALVAVLLAGCAGLEPYEPTAGDERQQCVYQRTSQMDGYIVCYGYPAPITRAGD